ncbi:hypothetical protein M0811_14223 [Anaeramoeba ignava]|uniref:Uncharacterized protein n=1 Tax=Anaeramoeba ignava TaxID=1746090 RepID=A0A9Q0LZ92_ANAIG|nr:hypothetical protein M0811_14223 [Anaeramoeba ignava]
MYFGGSVSHIFYRYNGTNFELEQTLNESTSLFGYPVSIYEDVIVIGASGAKSIYLQIYGTFWNEIEPNFGVKQIQILDSLFQFMRMLLLLGFSGKNQAYIYRYNGTFWNQEQILSGPSEFGFFSFNL